jgi:hypothetical protein
MICAPAEIPKNMLVSRGTIAILDRDENDKPNQGILHRESRRGSTHLVCESSGDIESEHSMCPSSGSLSCSTSSSQTSGEADSPIACLAHSTQADIENRTTAIEVFDLDDLIRQQQESICLRRRVKGSVVQPFSRRERDAHNLRSYGLSGRSAVKVMTLDQNWKAYLGTLPKEIFGSREAFQNRAEAAVRGKPLFSGLRIDEDNNADMQRESAFIYIC